MLRRVLGILSLAVLGLGSTSPAPTRVLFIGNSLTTANDLAGMVQALGQAAHRPVACRVVAFNDFSLEDHWARGAAQKAIAEGGWAFVVLQQGPSALPASEVLLRDYVGRYAALIRQVGARPALYMVWPAAARKGDFEGVHRSYATAAADVGGLFVPAGDAWLEMWRRDPSAALYGPDGFHPTLAGSYLAAAVMYGAFFQQSPVGLPALGLPADQVRVLQASAATALQASRAALPRRMAPRLVDR
jgi:hypothetical protein